MSRSLAVVAAVLCACSGAPPRDPDAPPDLLVVVVPSTWGAAPPEVLAPHVLHFPQAQSVHTTPESSWRALVTGQWPGTAGSARPNTMQSVLGLYGYRTVGRVPAFDLHPSVQFLTDGFDAATFSADGCLADHLSALARIHPEGTDRAVFAVVASSRGDCDPAREQAALAGVLSGPHSAHRITAVVSIDASDWREPDASAPLYFAGGGFVPGARQGFASLVDLVPTLLTEGRAVVPSDASGTPLQPSSERAMGPQVVFQQAPGGTVGIRTPDHLLFLTGIDGPLPAQLPEATTPVVQPLRDGVAPVAEVVAPLYQALAQWDRQRRATSAADRMGSDAFRDMLRDQGYWH